MGSGPGICNLYGHIYLICEGHDIKKKVIRLMTSEERDVVGGFNPQLLIWGRYPAESCEYPRSQLKVPVPEFEIKPDSILHYQKKKKKKKPNPRVWVTPETPTTLGTTFCLWAPYVSWWAHPALSTIF
ncbi:hypothetical protein F4813DRAFT_372564 [Daldinia decipiens]|uniref:uncharacterized protein n=1 Tax=Daldinia decipiens TaxID=326647 RepID=UPI0020C3ED7C|nr:uncharacterized protein F4813DRAFT_372564 [Daldinia decipiens]KAI1653934.1 hypothetical protein F4813DRAFT_372564 [Daldinia decipiens]